jgi:hypothetical protein
MNHKTLVFLVDKSASMKNISNDVIRSINNVIIAQQNNCQNVNVDIIYFDSEYFVEVDNTPIHQIGELKHYPVGGSTALYDTIYYAIKRHRSTNNALFIIVTDGEENASVFLKGKTGNFAIKHLIEQKRKIGWEFLHLSNICNSIDIGACHSLICHLDNMPKHIENYVSYKISRFLNTSNQVMPGLTIPYQY